MVSSIKTPFFGVVKFQKNTDWSVEVWNCHFFMVLWACLWEKDGSFAHWYRNTSRLLGSLQFKSAARHINVMYLYLDWSSPNSSVLLLRWIRLHRFECSKNMKSVKIYSGAKSESILTNFWKSMSIYCFSLDKIACNIHITIYIWTYGLMC